MTTIKLDSKLAANAASGIEPYVPGLYATLGKRVVGIVEFAAVERTQAAPDEDKDVAVKVQMKHLEIADGPHEEHVRRALRALHTQRTAQGTLNEDDEVELSERTLAACAGEINAVEAARLRLVIEQWAGYARRVLHTATLTQTELRQELTTVADALYAAIHPDAIRTKAGADRG